LCLFVTEIDQAKPPPVVVVLGMMRQKIDKIQTTKKLLCIKYER